MADEYTRCVPMPVWPPTLGGQDGDTIRTTVPVPRSVYEFLKNPGDGPAPLTGPFLTRADELAAYHPFE